MVAAHGCGAPGRTRLTFGVGPEHAETTRRERVVSCDTALLRCRTRGELQCILSAPSDIGQRACRLAGAHMAYELVEEVLDHAPAMTAAERLILVCIAEKARLPERAAKITGEELARRTGGSIGERGIRQALTRLAERGLEVRVPIGYDKHGGPVYAVPGRVRHFHVPHFRPAPGDCRCHGCRALDRAVFLSSNEAEAQFHLPIAEDGEEEPQCRQAEPQFPPFHP